MRSICLVVTVVVALTGCAAEQSDVQRVIDAATVARIDSTLEQFVASGRVSGASALVFERGQETYFGVAGLADREQAIPMARETIVQIFSMTKPITGVALMTLHEDGAFNLDDPVAKYLPEFAGVRVYDGESNGAPILKAPLRAMTIRDLTRHTTGLTTSTDHPVIGPMVRAADAMNREHTLSEMAQKLASVPLLYHPGEQWLYGPAVDVQALLVERLSGAPFAEYVSEHVLSPLGMNETRYVVPPGELNRFAALYSRSQGIPPTRVPDAQAHAFNTQSWPLTRGGSGLTSTLDDYMRFAQMLVQEGQLDGVRILKPETVRLMATNHLDESITERSWLPSKGEVGFGIDFAVRLRPPVDANENYGVVGEFFWDGAASTLFWVDPANDLTVVFFVQLVPFDGVGLHKELRDAVYGARR